MNAGWQRALARIAGAADAASDRARRRLRAGRSPRRPLLVVPYLGFGTAGRLAFSGRVIEDAGFAVASPSDRGWTNLVQFAKRLRSDEVPGARLVARIGQVAAETRSDDEGYFAFELELPTPLAAAGWHDVRLELADARDDAPTAPASAQVLVPPAAARFGVISDIDDTVVRTHATQRLKMLAGLARSNAHTRKPFAGVAALYRALQRGPGGSDDNPLFYVSSSPWNLYPPLVEFLGVQDIPLGPLLLRDFGEHMLFEARDHHAHKRAAIERILQTYPGLPFVLIGDSGEQDPEIYSAIVRAHADRVRAIYIRSVHADPARSAALDRLAESVRPTGAQLVLVPDSAFAAAHAAGEGLIAADAPAAVRDEVRRDALGAPQRVKPASR